MNTVNKTITTLKQQLQKTTGFAPEQPDTEPYDYKKGLAGRHNHPRKIWQSTRLMRLLPDNIAIRIVASDKESLIGQSEEAGVLVEGNFILRFDATDIPVKTVWLNDQWYLFPGSAEGRGLIWLLHKTAGLNPSPSIDNSSVESGDHAPELSKIPGRSQYTEEARLRRLDFLRQAVALPEECYEHSGFKAESLSNNIENYIGSIEIPVGVAGPLIINGQQVQGEVFAPIATTEGALVATIAKGAQNLSRAGGVRTRVLDHRLMRAPVFDFYSLEDSELFVQWLEDHIDSLRLQISRHSRYAKLIGVTPHCCGQSVHVEFIYTTGDASGQNMTTTCTWNACHWIVGQLSHIGVAVRDYRVEANLSSDKKVSYKSFLKGRGIRVLADIHISESMARTFYQTSSEDLVKAYQRAAAGSVRAGMIGINMNVANVIGGIFTATGQDIACVHESSTAHLHIEKTDTGFYASMLLPSLVIATVGGGTQLPDQQAGLAMLGCNGPGKVYALAEIIAGFALALDLCSLAAIDNGRFATAHEQLGRNKPMNLFAFSDLNPHFFTQGLQEYYGSDDLVVEEASLLDTEGGTSIITGLLGANEEHLVGHFPFTLNYRFKGERRTQAVMVKSKPLDQEMLANLTGVAAACGPALAELFPRYREQLDLSGCHKKELGIYRQRHPDFIRRVPTILQLYENDERKAHVVVMNYFDGGRLMNTEADTSVWTDADIQLVLRDLAALHAIHFQQTDGLDTDLAVAPFHNSQHIQSLSVLFDALSDNAFAKLDWFTDADLATNQQLLAELPQWRGAIDAHPKTLIHNDFNPRNVFINTWADGGETSCVYDWELAKIHLPQHDLVEFLLFTLQVDQFDNNTLEHWLETYRQQLQRATGVELDAGAWRAGFIACLKEYRLFRLGLYMMVHCVSPFSFTERVFKVSRQMLGLLNHE